MSYFLVKIWLILTGFFSIYRFAGNFIRVFCGAGYRTKEHIFEALMNKFLSAVPDTIES